MPTEKQNNPEIVIRDEDLDPINFLERFESYFLDVSNIETDGQDLRPISMIVINYITWLYGHSKGYDCSKHPMWQESVNKLFEDSSTRERLENLREQAVCILKNQREH